MKNLNKQIKRIGGRSMKGLVKSAIIIRRDMDRTAPKIPVDWGNLRASWFVVTATTTPQGSSPRFEGDQASTMSSDHSAVISKQRAKIKGFGKPVVAIGFSANYAAFVHGMQGAKFQRPGSGAGFFSSALTRNKAIILTTIANEARI